MKLKKILAFTTSLLLCCGAVSYEPLANFVNNHVTAVTQDDSGSCGVNCTYSFYGSTGTLVISGTDDMRDYFYSMDGNNEKPWDSYKDEIKTVIIEDGVTSIGVYAFEYCSSLTSITIPNSVTSIGENAFSWCNSLTNITIPDSVTYIGGWAFSGCTSLTSINVDENNKSYSSADGVLFNKNKTKLIICPIGNTRTNYTIPDSVTSINERAFSGCTSLTSITIPDGVTSIGGGAFYNCAKLLEITIPDSVTSINELAFSGCTSLTDITIPDSVTSIYQDAFSNCSSLTEITIPSSVTEIGSYAFSNCSSLTEITIPSSVTEIGGGAFYNCTKLTDVYFKGTEDEWNAIEIAIWNDKLKNATIHYVGEEPTTADDSGSCGENCTYSFYGSTGTLVISGTGNMKDYYDDDYYNDYYFYFYSIPIPWYYTYREEIKTVIIENSVTSIGSNSFWDCYSLTEIIIPNSVTSIGERAFRNCTNLTDIYFKGTEEEWNAIEIDSSYNTELENATIHYVGEEPQETTTTEMVTTTTPQATTTMPQGTTTTAPQTTTTEVTTTTENSTQNQDKSLTNNDIWNFTNSIQYFGTGEYYISDEFYNDLKSKLSNKEKESIKKQKSNPWNGSCYGLAVLPILYKEGIFNVSEWQDNAENLIDIHSPNDDDIESLINYYYLLQKTEEIQQTVNNTMCNETNETKLNRLIELCSQIKDGGSPVLLCYFGDGYTFGGHAVTCYGIEYGSFPIDGVIYNGKILVYDSNCSDFDDMACLYFNSNNNRWTIPKYDLQYNEGSNNKCSLGLITNDLDLINNNGYLNDNDTDYMPNIDYIAMAQSSNINIINTHIQKVSNNNGDWSINSSADDDNDIVIFYDFMSSSNEELENQNIKIALRDATSGYQFKVLDGTELIDLDMSYENSLLSAYTDKGKSIKFDPNGCIEITADGQSSDFSLGMVFNEGYHDLSWYNVIVDGHNSNTATMEKVENGFILSSDNLINVTVSANNDNTYTDVNFTTTYDKVFIYEIDENTIGISVDENQDGTFETTIAQSSENIGTSIGDLNGDDSINVMDLLMLKKYVLKIFTDSDIDMINADLNNDDNVNVMDLLLLKKVVLKIISIDDINS